MGAGKIMWRHFVNPPRPIGINDTLMDNRESKTSTYVREICQNSNDARSDFSTEPVRIVFKRRMIPVDKFPDLENYRRSVDNCIVSAQKYDKNPHPLQVMTGIKNIIDGDEICVMQVSDYNTTGLVGFCTDDDILPWNRLTVGNGIANKGGGAGGSKGVGKNSFYEVSAMRTLFFQTRLPDGRQSFVGRCSFMPFRDNGTKMDSVGFYGFDDKGYETITDPSLFPEFVEPREQAGSDIYIMGYDDTSEDWQSEIKLTVVKGFFVAILDGKLVVDVDGSIIDKDSIDGIISNLLTRKDADKDFDLRTLPLVIEAYRNGQKYHFDLEQYMENGVYTGGFDVYLLKTEENCRIITTKDRSGMTINPRYRNKKFSGVVVARGKFAEDLTDTENPTHTDWNSGNLDPGARRDFIKGLINSMGQKVSNLLREIEGNTDSNSVNAAGLGRILGVKGSGADGQPVSTISGNAVVTSVRRGRSKSDSGTSATRQEQHDPVRDDPKDDDPQYGHGGKRRRNKSGTRIKPGDGAGSGAKPVSFDMPDAKITNPRYISCGDGQYRVAFNIDKDKQIKFQLTIAFEGEDSKTVLPVLSAKDSFGAFIGCKDGTIGPFQASKDVRNVITVNTNYPVQCAVRMRVVR